MKKFFLFILSLVTLSATSAALVYVQAANPHVTTTLPTQAQGNGKLLGGQMQACLAHQNAIQTRSGHMANLAQNMETKFTNIAQRVEQYYSNTVLPSGKTVSNYSALVADIQTKENAVNTAVATAQTDATNFSCSSTDPKGQLTTFRADMQAVVSALKDYRTAIKNLIVAVHTVVGDTTETPTPSTTVTQTPTTTTTVSPTSNQ